MGLSEMWWRLSRSERRTSCDNPTLSVYEKAKIAGSTSASSTELYKSSAYREYFNIACSSVHKFKIVKSAKYKHHEN